MTCREKLTMEHPDSINDVEFAGGCKGCPSGYGYLEDPADEFCGGGEAHCRACWDREIPGTLPMQYKIDTEAEAELAKPEPQWTKENPHILDSGDRTEFASGAVRDMREGKGRCDLMPLHVLGDFFKDGMFTHLAHFIEDQTKTDHLYACLHMAWHMWDSKETMFLEVAKHFEEGAKKYGENNWQKGIPPKCYIDSAVRHYIKWKRGDRDEPHDRACVWNLICCIWEVDYHKVTVEEEPNND